ncbi:MAG: hypothetical protein JWO40_266 [Candidatus Doudnabacteria bacterium]|nr:hypothetical protein [Candidatus Doudnabacteria bacterium]
METSRKPLEQFEPIEQSEGVTSNELATHMLGMNILMKDIDRFTDSDFDKLFRKWPIDKQVKFKELVEKNLPSEIQVRE